MQRSSIKRNQHRNKLYIILGIVAALLVIYIGGMLHYSNTFMPNTSIDSVNVSGKSSTEAQKMLNDHLDRLSIKLVKGDKTYKVIKGSDTGLNLTSEPVVTTTLKNQKTSSWPLRLLHITGTNASITKNLSSTSKNKINAFAKKTANALNKKLNPTPTVVTDTVLDTSSQHVISAKLLAQKIQSSIANGKNSIDLKSTYQKSSANKSDIQKQYDKILNEKVVYDVNGTKVTIPTSTIKKWILLTYDAYGYPVLSVDQTQLTTYLGTLNDKYATYGSDFTFNSTKRGSQTVKGDTLGWSIDTATDTATLTTKILASKSFSISATITGSGQTLEKGKLGSTYVEVDKKNQHMWYYKDGKLVLSTDVVTGMPAANDASPSGAFFVWEKQRNATLRGKNADGSAYASPVSYWMPIDYTGVGLHDSPWQPQYGGDWYLTHGSHGCVNTPPKVMKKLYAAVKLGTPVVLF